MVSYAYLRQASGLQASCPKCDRNLRLTWPRLPINQQQKVGQLAVFSAWLRLRASYHYIASAARTQRPD